MGIPISASFMSAISSWVDVINICLFELGCNPIQTLTDITKQGRAGIQNYQQCANAILRMKPWKSAAARTTLAEVSVPPIFGYGHAYQLPVDYIRMIMVHPSITSHKIERRLLLTNNTDAQIIYVQEQSTPVYLDPLLVDTMALYLAWRIGYALIQKQDIIDKMEKKWLLLYRLAKMADSFENSPLTWEAMELQTARIAGTTYNGVAQINNVGNF